MGYRNAPEKDENPTGELGFEASFPLLAWRCDRVGKPQKSGLYVKIPVSFALYRNCGLIANILTKFLPTRLHNPTSA
jgi:hypothetical protein